MTIIPMRDIEKYGRNRAKMRRSERTGICYEERLRKACGDGYRVL